MQSPAVGPDQRPAQHRGIADVRQTVRIRGSPARPGLATEQTRYQDLLHRTRRDPDQHAEAAQERLPPAERCEKARRPGRSGRAGADGAAGLRVYPAPGGGEWPAGNQVRGTSAGAAQPAGRPVSAADGAGPPFTAQTDGRETWQLEQRQSVGNRTIATNCATATSLRASSRWRQPCTSAEAQASSVRATARSY